MGNDEWQGKHVTGWAWIESAAPSGYVIIYKFLLIVQQNPRPNVCFGAVSANQPYEVPPQVCYCAG